MTCLGDKNTLNFMIRLLDDENPDLVVFTGDNINGKSTSDARTAILKYSWPVVERQIPWVGIMSQVWYFIVERAQCSMKTIVQANGSQIRHRSIMFIVNSLRDLINQAMVYGNHDDEADLTREEMFQTIKEIPYSLARKGPADIDGVGNYVVMIYTNVQEENQTSANTGSEQETSPSTPIRCVVVLFMGYSLDPSPNRTLNGECIEIMFHIVLWKESNLTFSHSKWCAHVPH